MRKQDDDVRDDDSDDDESGLWANAELLWVCMYKRLVLHICVYVHTYVCLYILKCIFLVVSPLD